MIKELRIRKISAVETYSVRHPMLRVGRPITDCIFKGDNKKKTLHLGGFIQQKLVGVCSAYQKKHAEIKADFPYQIRGMAVLSSYQKKGIGKAMMQVMESQLALQAVDMIWLNARENAMSFYQSLDYNCHGEPFEIEKIGTHYCYYKSIIHA